MFLKKIFNDLIVKFEFWRASKLEVEKDYTFMVDASRPDYFSIKILNKKYKDVIVEFGKIEVRDDGKIDFEIDIISNPLLKNTDSICFKTFTTDIFRGILIDSLKNAEKILNENRKSNSVQSNQKRNVLEENDSIS
jgi:hypothetical protein